MLWVLDAHTRALHVLVSSWYVWSLELKKKDGNVRLFELQVPLSRNQPVVALHTRITVALWKHFWNVLPEQPSTSYGPVGKIGHTGYFIQWGLSTRKGLHRVKGKKGTPRAQQKSKTGIARYAGVPTASHIHFRVWERRDGVL